AVIDLLTQPDPYEIDGPTSWLSVDLQVFRLQQGQALPAVPGIVMGTDPHAFLAALLANSGGGYNDPTLARAPNPPFDLDLLAHQATSTVTTAGTAGMLPVFNFAVARVRYRALSTPAPDIRAFFRVFQASTTSTNYGPVTYAVGGTGGNRI